MCAGVKCCSIPLADVAGVSGNYRLHITSPTQYRCSHVVVGDSSPKLEHKEVAFALKFLTGVLDGVTESYLAAWLGVQLEKRDVMALGQAVVLRTTDRSPNVHYGVVSCPFLIHVTCFSHVLYRANV